MTGFQHLALAGRMRAKARTGWYTGDEASLQRYGAREIVASLAEPELMISLLLSRDRMHHSVGWWRNADYEYCWHLSISAIERAEWERTRARATLTNRPVKPNFEEVPKQDLDYWAQLIFGEHIDKLWNEPGGTDPRLTPVERHGRHVMWHLRLFLEPLTMEPFIPTGEVYHLTRWIPGLTPEKVDR